MRKEKGFTLIELMIVVAIIAILAAIALPAFGVQIKKSKDSKAIEMLSAMRSQVTMIQTDLSGYAPSNADILQIMTNTGTYQVAAVADEFAKLTPVQGFGQAHNDGIGVTKKLKAGTPATGVTWNYIEDNAHDTWVLSIQDNTTKDTKSKNWYQY